jgi:hypothetical protein
MEITLLIKKTGFANNQLIYPACEKSKIFAAMYNQKTFTRENITQIENLGFSIDYVNSEKLQSATAGDEEIFKHFN